MHKKVQLLADNAQKLRTGSKNLLKKCKKRSAFLVFNLE